MSQALAAVIGRTPLVGALVRRRYWKLVALVKGSRSFPGSAQYWERRYGDGRTSGAGSYGLLAEFKAEVINQFVAARGVRSVIELGCGDGNQLELANYPTYLGMDVSSTAISKCRKRFESDARKSFRLASEYKGEKAELALSLDVVYHLVEDHVFETYMAMLFDASGKYVIIYSSDTDENRGDEGLHVRHRKFTQWVNEHRPSWKLVAHLPNRYPYRGARRTASFAEFFIYERSSTPTRCASRQ